MLQAWLFTFLASVATLLVNILDLSKSSLDQVSTWVNYGNLLAFAIRVVGMVAKLIYLRFCNEAGGVVHGTVEGVTVQDADSSEQHNYEADHDPSRADPL